MKNIMVLEDDKINEYELEYDQEYMDIILEEYRKNFSYLRKQSINLSSFVSKRDIMKKAIGADDIVNYSISNCNGDDYFRVDFICANNPVAYVLLKDDNNKFYIDDRRIFTLYSWYKALSNYKWIVSRDVSPHDDFMNFSEVENVKQNLTDLLEGVSLRYVGEASGEIDKKNARCNKEFIDEFNIQKQTQKVLKK